MKHRNAFTLVELLAVIVILAIILVIAVPKITDTIKNSKIASFESSAKTIAAQAEKKKMENEILENQNPINCNDVVKLNDTDYDSCSITFDGNTAKVSLIGKGKFEGLKIVNGTKDNAAAVETTGDSSTKTATEYIKELYNDVSSRTANGLDKDTTSDENIRYVGANPNNYVSFNDELWRIIGVFGSNLKLVRDDILTTYSFDNKTTAQGIETNTGTNDWSNSYIREFLNDYYYDGKTITCHSKTSDSSTTNATIECPDINKINEVAKNMIQRTTWNLGGTSSLDSSADDFYMAERGTGVFSGHATISTDYIGLIYASDYGYASSDESCRKSLGVLECKNSNWLHKKIDYWLVTPSSSYADFVFYVTNYGGLFAMQASYLESVLPSVYLNSNVEITGGSGTSSDPYILK
ncbi:MAG: prepilin-type N-terminal cleavage/methylation domain-containing protein [bacterium]|nr:prepilin-type N-terminal cleavage/methylation domain-containing protein [bacterium]